MKTGRIVTLECRCGYRLFRYFKAGKGRIIKCFLARLEADFVGITGAENFSRPRCPQCGKELGIIMMIHGEPALKINHGTIKDIRI